MRATPEQRTELLDSVRRGDVGVDGLYGNMLTGLCRPEELVQCLAIGARHPDLRRFRKTGSGRSNMECHQAGRRAAD